MHRKLDHRFKLNHRLAVRPWLFGLMSICVFILVGCASSVQSASLATPTLTAEQQLGQKVFELHCQSCHSTIPDSIIVGPSMAGVARRAGDRIEGMDAREYVRASITKPGQYLVEGYPDLMPSTLSETLSEEEVAAVLSYILTLEE